MACAMKMRLRIRAGKRASSELESAARFMHIPFRTLGDLFAAGKLHVVEQGSSALLVCGNSILKISRQDLQD